MRFLFCAVASHGFVYPAIGIAQALRQRGHEVAFVTGLDFAETLRQAGFERIPRGAQDGPSFQVKHWGLALSAAIQVKHIEYAMERFKPDALVGQQLTLGPLLVHERQRLPLGIVGLSTYLWPTASALAAERQPSDGEARRAWRYGDMLRLLNDARRLFQLPPIDAPPEAPPLLGDMFLVQSVPELAGDPADLPARVHLTGACLWEPPSVDAELRQWLEEADTMRQPVLYVQHGRTFDHPRFWPNFVAAAGDQPIRVVAATGRLDGDLGAIPPNFFVRSHISQAQALPHARAVISSGTTTPVLGALLHGLPSILLPAGGEQLDVAEQCERAGTAVILPPDSDSATIGKAIERILQDGAMRCQAQTLQRAFTRINGSERAAAYLETLGIAHAPVGEERV